MSRHLHKITQTIAGIPSQEVGHLGAFDVIVSTVGRRDDKSSHGLGLCVELNH